MIGTPDYDAEEALPPVASRIRSLSRLTPSAVPADEQREQVNTTTDVSQLDRRFDRALIAVSHGPSS